MIHLVTILPSRYNKLIEKEHSLNFVTSEEKYKEGDILHIIEVDENEFPTGRAVNKQILTIIPSEGRNKLTLINLSNGKEI